MKKKILVILKHIKQFILSKFHFNPQIFKIVNVKKAKK